MPGLGFSLHDMLGISRPQQPAPGQGFGNILAGAAQPQPMDEGMDVPQHTTEQLLGPQQAPQQQHGVNWLGVLADALSGAAGQPGMYAQRMNEERQHDRQRQETQADWGLKRNAEMQDWQAKQDYDRAHPNDQLTQYMDAAGISQDKRPGMYGQRVESMINPPRMFTDPATGQVMMMGGASPAAPAPRRFDTLPPGAVPEGGAGSQAPRPFRR